MRNFDLEVMKKISIQACFMGALFSFFIKFGELSSFQSPKGDIRKQK